MIFSCSISAQVSFDSAAGWAVLVLNSFGIFWCVLAAVLLFLYRSTKTIKASQTQLTQLFLVGAIGLNASAITMLGENTTILCQSRAWLFYSFFTLGLAPLLIKAYRIHRIFNTTQLQTSVLPVHLLFGACLFLVTIDVVFLSIITAQGGLDGISVQQARYNVIMNGGFLLKT